MSSRCILWLVLFCVSVVLCGGSDRGERDEQVARLRARLAVYGPLMALSWEGKAPKPAPGKRDPSQDVWLELEREPRDLLIAAMNEGLRKGGFEERLGALACYLDLRYSRAPEFRVTPEYNRIFLDLLSGDDLTSRAYTGHLVVILSSFYPSAESLQVMMDAAARCTDRELRISIVNRASDMVGLPVSMRSEAPPAIAEARMAEFEAWYAQNKDRIRFTKEGYPRLTGGEAQVDRAELTEDDREAVRREAPCVVRLMNDVFENEVTPEALARLEQCGAALFGPEGAAAIREALSLPEGAQKTMEQRASLSFLQGKYPTTDAWILGAAYVVANQKDPALLDQADDVLVQFSPKDVKRVLRGEPKRVRKEALAWANEERGSRQD